MNPPKFGSLFLRGAYTDSDRAREEHVERKEGTLHEDRRPAHPRPPRPPFAACVRHTEGEKTVVATVKVQREAQGLLFHEA
jgi:hypothetical protein